MKTILMTAIAALLLAGCAGGPGKGDVEEAMRLYVQEAAGVVPTFEDLEVGKCKESGSGPGYACSVTGKMSVPRGRGTQTENMVGTFVFDKVDGQWRVVAHL